jgi:hypothetical protein
MGRKEKRPPLPREALDEPNFFLKGRFVVDSS